MKRKTSEKRQKQIKDAVLEIINKEGLHNLSIKNLAKIVGITEGAIFRHFNSKRAIIINIMDDVKTELMTKLRSIAKSNISADKKLLNYLYCHIEYLVKNRGVSILLYSEAAHLNYKVLRKRLHDILSEQESLITSIIKDGMKKCGWNNKVSVKYLALLFMSIPMSLNVEKIFNQTTVKVYSNQMFNLIMKILVK